MSASSTTRVLAKTALLAVVLAVLGLSLWTLALIGSARYADGLCDDDLIQRPDYRATSRRTTRWPPQFECRLAGRDVPPVVVRHRIAGVGITFSTVVFPIGYLAGASAALVAFARRWARSAMEP